MATKTFLKEYEQLVKFKVFYKTKNEGKGSALRAGFEKAVGEIIVVQDADLEYDPTDYPVL
jgi:glycosyltransferase involved in cell wall biosynthesis